MSMKRFLILLSFALAFICNIKSQDISTNVIPNQVKKAFQHKYFNVTNAKWEIKNQYYEVAFRLDLKKHTSEFDKAGIWLNTRTTLKLVDVTIAIKNAIKKSFSKYRIIQINKVESKDKASFYEIIFNQSSTDITIQFAPEGKILDRKVDIKE